jgi:hypothetical protein
MRLFSFAAFVALIVAPRGRALLEEDFVSFGPGATSLSITSAPILCAQDDFKGVHIAVDSLARDFEQITGAKREVRRGTVANVTAGSAVASAIIVGSANSSLIQHLTTSKVISVSDIQGKWETFKTMVVADPLPGVAQALIIVGSDKRGTIFGIHTLAEQSGQSPYVLQSSYLAMSPNLLGRIDTTGLPMYRPRSASRSTPCQRLQSTVSHR